MSDEMENNEQAKKIAAEAAIVKVGVKEFLSAFYEENQTVFLRLFNDRKTEGQTVREFTPKLCDVESIIPELQSLNKRNYGVFFNVNAARTDKEITKIRAQFFEADDLPIEEQLESISDFPLKPSIIVRTRKSLHVYFLVKDGKVEAFRKIQQKLALQFNGDKTIVNESRVMRIPLFNHCKEEPVMVECLSFNPELIYTQEELERFLPDLEVVKPASTVSAQAKIEFEKGTKEQLNYLIENCDFMVHCKDHAAFLPEIDWYSMVTNLCVFQGGSEKIHELSKSYPRYSEFETDQKIEHFLNSGTSPMNCRTIAEKGFVCPNIGSCKCHSPAGLPFTEKITLKLPEWYEETKGGSLKFMPGVLASYLVKEIPSIYIGERFYVYTGGVYSEKSDYEAQRIVREHLLETKVRTSEISDVISQWKMLIYKDTDQININKDIINVKNGLYNIKTKEITPHSSDYLSTIGINASYDNTADCPKFKSFLNEVLEPELIPFVQQIFGYCCTMHMEAQKAFCLKGVPKSGKSTILGVIETLVGRKNFSNVSWQDLSGRFNTATLFGKILNTFGDLPTKAIEDSSIFKALTSPDMLQVERKGKDPFQFLPFCKLLFSANDMPLTLGDKGDGYFRRIMIIRFQKQIPEDKINPNLIDELLLEIDGIFNWAMQGLGILANNKFSFPKNKIIDEELFKYKYASNNVLAFIEDECELDPLFEIYSEELFRHYQYVCNSNGLRPMSKNNFTDELMKNYGKQVEKGRDPKYRRSIWKGIRVLDESQIKNDESQLDDAINALNHHGGQVEANRRPYKD